MIIDSKTLLVSVLLIVITDLLIFFGDSHPIRQLFNVSAYLVLGFIIVLIESNELPEKKKQREKESKIHLLKVQKLDPYAVLPTRQTDGSAGYDLCALADCTLERGYPKKVLTGIAIEIPPSYYGRIAPRSSLAINHGISVCGGVIDSDYRGDIAVLLFKHTNYDYTIKKGDRIAQLIITKIITPKVIECKELNVTMRGQGGFGSTGIK